MRTYRVIGIALVVQAAFVLSACSPEQIAAFMSVASVIVQPDTVDVDVNEQWTLTAAGVNGFGVPILGAPPTWTVADPTIAEVSASGDVRGLAEGITIVTATVSGKEGHSVVRVRKAAVATVTVTPGEATVATAKTVQLTATLRSASEKVLTGRTVTWSSASPMVATVSPTGLVTAVAVGSAVVTATSEGKSGNATITVNTVPVATVTVTPASASLNVAATVQLTATPKDASGNSLSGRSATWSTSNASAATVTTAGLVTAVAVGAATITATIEGVPGTSAITVASDAPPPPPSANDPELPRVLLDTKLVPPTGNTIDVAAGGNLQAAINAAAPCDVIRVAPGATYVGPFTLPNKAGDCWITIRSAAADASLPAEGSRMTPAYTSALPKLVSPDDRPAIQTAAGAHHFRLMALEITVSASATINYGIVRLGGGENALSLLPHHIILDRVYVHGHSTLNVSRCVALNDASTAVIDSYLSECHAKGFDSQAICGWGGPGPFKIVNNYLEGAGETVMFGGADPSIVNVSPADIEVRHNHFSRPPSWKGVWTVKNHFELKHAKRVLVEGNLFENHWADAQDGFALGVKSVNQDGSAPWSEVSDFTFRYNRLRNSGAGINIAAKPEPYDAVPASRMKISNNVFENINVGVFTGHGRLYQVLDGPANVTIEHNTTFNSDGSNALMMFDGAPPKASNFIFRDNVSTHAQYGVAGSGAGVGKPALDYYAAPGYIFRRNVIIAGDGSIYPTDNYFPASIAAVAFVNQAGGNYRLASGSAYKGKATDGTDPGANIDVLEAKLAGVVVP